MSKLKEEELLEWLKIHLPARKWLKDAKWSEKDEQAYQQMREMIRKKPEVTEEWIEEKELKLFRAIIKSSIIGGRFIRHFTCPTKIGTQLRKDFIRSLVKEIQGK